VLLLVGWGRYPWPVILYASYFAFIFLDAFVKNKNLVVALLAIIAVMVKGTAIFVCVTVFIASLILYFDRSQNVPKNKNLMWGTLALACVVLKLYAAFFILQ